MKEMPRGALHPQERVTGREGDGLAADGDGGDRVGVAVAVSGLLLLAAAHRALELLARLTDLVRARPVLVVAIDDLALVVRDGFGGAADRDQDQRKRRESGNQAGDSGGGVVHAGPYLKVRARPPATLFAQICAPLRPG